MPSSKNDDEDVDAPTQQRQPFNHQDPNNFSSTAIFAGANDIINNNNNNTNTDNASDKSKSAAAAAPPPPPVAAATAATQQLLDGNFDPESFSKAFNQQIDSYLNEVTANEHQMIESGMNSNKQGTDSVPNSAMTEHLRADPSLTSLAEKKANLLAKQKRRAAALQQQQQQNVTKTAAKLEKTPPGESKEDNSKNDETGSIGSIAPLENVNSLPAAVTSQSLPRNNNNNQGNSSPSKRNNETNNNNNGKEQLPSFLGITTTTAAASPPSSDNAPPSLSPTMTRKKTIFEIEYGDSDFSIPERKSLRAIRADEEVYELLRKNKMKQEKEEEEYLLEAAGQKGLLLVAGANKSDEDNNLNANQQQQGNNRDDDGAAGDGNSNNNNNNNNQPLRIFSTSFARSHQEPGAAPIPTSTKRNSLGNTDSKNNNGKNNDGENSNNSNSNNSKNIPANLSVQEARERRKQLQIEETRRRVMNRTNSDGGFSSVGGSSHHNNNNNSNNGSQRRHNNNNNRNNHRRPSRSNYSSSDSDDDSCNCREVCRNVFSPSWITLKSLFWTVLIPGVFYVTWVGLHRASGRSVCKAGECDCSEANSIIFAFSIGLISSLPRAVFFAFLLEMTMRYTSEPPIGQPRVWLLSIVSVFASIGVEAIVAAVGGVTAYQAARFVALALPTLVYGIMGSQTMIGMAITGLACLPVFTELVVPIYDEGDGRRYLILLWPFLMLVCDRFVTHLLFVFLPTKIKLVCSLAIALAITSFFQMSIIAAALSVDYDREGLAVGFCFSVAFCEALQSLHTLDVIFNELFWYVQRLIDVTGEKMKSFFADAGVEGVLGRDYEMRAATNNRMHDGAGIIISSSGSPAATGNSASASTRGGGSNKNDMRNTNTSSNNNNSDGNPDGNSSDAGVAAAMRGSPSLISVPTTSLASNNSENEKQELKGGNNNASAINSSQRHNNNNSNSSNNPAATRKRFYTNDLRLMGTNCRLTSLILTMFIAALQLAINRYPVKYRFSQCDGTLIETSGENSLYGTWWKSLALVFGGIVCGQCVAVLWRWVKMINHRPEGGSGGSSGGGPTSSSRQSWLVIFMKLKLALSFFPMPGRMVPVLVGMTVANWYLQVLFGVVK